MCNLFIHFWHAPLVVCNAKCRHQSPEWTILNHVNCFIEGEVNGFQVLMDSLSTCMLASRWSPPVLQGEAANILVSVSSGIHTLLPKRRNAMLGQ